MRAHGRAQRVASAADDRAAGRSLVARNWLAGRAVLPGVAAPVAAYVPAVRSGSYVFTSGQLPMVDGSLAATGKVGAEVSAEDAKQLAATCALNAWPPSRP